MKQKLLLILSVFFLVVVICLKIVSAVPELPMIVSGNVSINDKPAKIGTSVSVELNGKEIIKVKTTEIGKFTILLQKLNEENNITIYVDGIDSSQSIAYKSGDFRQLSLKVEKSYLIYYIIGVVIALAIIFIAWKPKKYH
ncbi:MAG: hypothetical protein Q7R52_00500 [archaeon]|nr:hypothetical protein [archaeon]